MNIVRVINDQVRPGSLDQENKNCFLPFSAHRMAKQLSRSVRGLDCLRSTPNNPFSASRQQVQIGRGRDPKDPVEE